MNKKATLFITLLATTLFIAGCTPPGDTTPPGPGKYAAIAQCLTQKGVKFYGAYWCPHCADQKKIFGSDMQYVAYVECDPNGKNAKPDECQKAGVEKYPTWFFPGQGIITGVQDPVDLAAKANCPTTAEVISTTSQQTSEPVSLLQTSQQTSSEQTTQSALPPYSPAVQPPSQQ